MVKIQFWSFVKKKLEFENKMNSGRISQMSPSNAMENSMNF